MRPGAMDEHRHHNEQLWTFLGVGVRLWLCSQKGPRRELGTEAFADEMVTRGPSGNTSGHERLCPSQDVAGRSPTALVGLVLQRSSGRRGGCWVGGGREQSPSW